MLAPLASKLDRLISLIPNTGVQFIDLGLNINEHKKYNRSFWERPKDDGSGLNVLRALELDENGDLVDRETGAQPHSLTGYVEEGLYPPISGVEAINTFEGQWLPIPFHRATRDGYANGPSNWARMRIVTLAEPDSHGNTHRITLAFETELLKSPQDGQPYLAPSPKDSESSQEFALNVDEQSNAWWLKQEWVEGWLNELLDEYRRNNRRAALDPQEAKYRSFEHWARFLTLIGLVNRAVDVPRVRIAVPGTQPVFVDLVLDVGNSRTYGLLIEASREEGPALTNSYELELRDLTEPEKVYREPFETRLEFALAAFGKEIWSRRGGRARAFNWPTVSRIGPEATRLALASRGTEGNTGISSPKRYLWDLRKSRREWRFNVHGLETSETQSVTKGVFVGLIDDEGRPLDPRGNALPAIYAHYSRSSLMLFALAEVILQALTQINSYERRSVRAHSDVPRRLRNIVLTMPTAMPLEERKLFEQRARDAVMLLWRAIGWDRPADLGDERFNERPAMPDVKLRWDEATCTQIVYLYSEIIEKYRGASDLLFQTLGKQRQGDKHSLRVASLDIGGGTSDLIITTYIDQAGVTANAANIAPTQNFREGFNVAGDDILRAVIERCVIPVIIKGVESVGVPAARELVKNLLGPYDTNQEQVARRKRFAEKTLVPIALRLLADYEATDPRLPSGSIMRGFAEFYDEDKLPDEATLEYLHHPVRQQGGTDFDIANLQFISDSRAIGRAVERTIGRVIDDFCEIIINYDCDMLLLTGRPSRLPAIGKLVRARMPVAPGRLQLMHNYRVGAWYPFRDVHDQIADPKTTVAVGAMLCQLAQGNLTGFFLDIEALKLTSTARFIGVAKEDGQMTREMVLFEDVNLDAEEIEEQEARVEVSGPVPIVFRQLDLERWPTTQIYTLELTDNKAGERLKLPLFVPIGRKAARREEDEERMKENFEVREGIEDRDKNPVSKREVTLRLQTLAITETAPGYWLDTGAFNLS